MARERTYLEYFTTGLAITVPATALGGYIFSYYGKDGILADFFLGWALLEFGSYKLMIEPKLSPADLKQFRPLMVGVTAGLLFAAAVTLAAQNKWIDTAQSYIYGAASQNPANAAQPRVAYRMDGQYPAYRPK